MRNYKLAMIKKNNIPNKIPSLFLVFLFYLLIAHCSQLTAMDFGLLLNQYAGFGSEDEENYFEYKAGLVPRFAIPAGENGEFIVSASFVIGYEDEDVFYYPELLRTEYSMRIGSWAFKVGRIPYTDPLGYIAAGLFDGFQVTHASSMGRFSLGVVYTGFIFKKSAYITMTDYDKELYDSELDYGEFSDTYFGSSRAIAALEWEHPAAAETLSLKVSALAQFDLNGEDDKLSSQYLIVKAGMPVNNFLFEAGGSFSFIQWEAADAEENQFAFAFDLGASYILPTNFYSRLALAVNYTSGSKSDKLTAFCPISTVFIGNIFEIKRQAITAISLDYSGRVNQDLGFSVIATYFVRNDLVTGTFPVSGAEKNEFFLGPEIFARVVWSPFSDLQLNLGAGAFFPSLGNNWPDADAQWKIALTAVLAIR